MNFLRVSVCDNLTMLVSVIQNIFAVLSVPLFKSISLYFMSYNLSHSCSNSSYTDFDFCSHRRQSSYRLPTASLPSSTTSTGTSSPTATLTPSPPPSTSVHTRGKRYTVLEPPRLPISQHVYWPPINLYMKLCTESMRIHQAQVESPC